MPLTQTGPTPNIQVERVVANTTGQVPVLNDGTTTLAVMMQLHVKSRTTTTAPGSPAEGDAYIVPSGSSGYTGASTKDVAFYSNGWATQTPKEGWRAYVEDEDTWVVYDGTNWVEDRGLVGSITAGITASTTQSQGQQPLTAIMNQVSTCANVDDVVTLPAAYKGRICRVANDGANQLQVFPASGDAIDAGSADASVSVSAGGRATFVASDTTTWIRF